MTPGARPQPHRSRRSGATSPRPTAWRALAGWDDTVYTHLSATVPGEPGAYLMNRFGLRFDEITASNLVKVNVRGEVIDGSGATRQPERLRDPRRVHAARPDATA